MSSKTKYIHTVNIIYFCVQYKAEFLTQLIQLLTETPKVSGHNLESSQT
jgi:hypothetical protein